MPTKDLGKHLGRYRSPLTFDCDYRRHQNPFLSNKKIKFRNQLRLLRNQWDMWFSLTICVFQLPIKNVMQIGHCGIWRLKTLLYFSGYFFRCTKIMSGLWIGYQSSIAISWSVKYIDTYQNINLAYLTNQRQAASFQIVNNVLHGYYITFFSAFLQ